MGFFIRLLFFGWAFAIVMVAAWLGLLGSFPTGRTTNSTAPPPAVAPPAVVSPARLAPLDAGSCPSPRLMEVDFYDQTPVLRPESQVAIVAFTNDVRAAPCVADLTGTFCAGDEAAAVLHGRGDPGGLDAAEQYRLSFERALAVATVLLANDVTVGSVVGTGAEGLEPHTEGTTGTGTDRDDVVARRVDVGLRCPATLRP